MGAGAGALRVPAPTARDRRRARYAQVTSCRAGGAWRDIAVLCDVTRAWRVRERERHRAVAEAGSDVNVNVNVHVNGFSRRWHNGRSRPCAQLAVVAGAGAGSEGAAAAGSFVSIDSATSSAMSFTFIVSS